MEEGGTPPIRLVHPTEATEKELCHMRVAVLCEFSGTVRQAFTDAGHSAISCDLLPSEKPGPHIQADCRTIEWAGYDLIIAHPPCTYLANSGARWWAQRQAEQAEALDFIRWLMALPAPRIAIENPEGRISTAIRKPDQIINPWQFGHPEWKKTHLWLKGLPPLAPTAIVEPTRQEVWRAPDSKDRWKRRSRTYTGIAAAMARQWGTA